MIIVTKIKNDDVTIITELEDEKGNDTTIEAKENKWYELNGLKLKHDENDWKVTQIGLPNENFHFGHLKLNYAAPYHYLAINMAIEFSLHPNYHPKMIETLTSRKYEDFFQPLKFGEYDSSKKDAIIDTFGKNGIVYGYCYLCVNVDKYGYVCGVFYGVTMVHCQCVKKLNLTKHQSDEFWVMIYVKLPELIEKDSLVTNKLLLRNALINEAVGKLWDAITFGNNILDRNAIYGINDQECNHPLTTVKFNWKLFREKILGIKSQINWDAFTSDLGKYILL